MTRTADPLPIRRDSWDVVVAGAGPAGAMSALGLARTGYSVLLVERTAFPRSKVCGCCLNMAAVAALQDAGLFSILSRLGARPLSEFRIASRNRQVAVRLPGGYAVSRQALDTALVEAARSDGVCFLPEVRASLQHIRSSGCTITLDGRFSTQTIRASVALCADGVSGSFLARKPDFDPDISPLSFIGISGFLAEQSAELPPEVIQMAVGSGGYVGMVEVEEGALNVAAAVSPSALRQADESPLRTVIRILKESGLEVPPNLRQAEWKGTAPLTRVRRVVGDRRLLILGDAAGYVEPFTGEGMAWALACGRLIVPVVRQLAASPDADLGRLWQQLYDRSVWRRQRVCRLLQKVLRKPTLFTALLRCSALTLLSAQSLVSAVNRPVFEKVSAYEA